MTGIALDHLVGGLEAGGGDVGHGQALVCGLVGAQHGSVGHQRKVNSVIKEMMKFIYVVPT